MEGSSASPSARGCPTCSSNPPDRIRTCDLLSVGLVALVIAGCAGGVTMPANGVTDTTATVKGLIFDPADGTVSYRFEYGATKSYGSETTHRSLVINDRDNHPVSEDLSGLGPGTTYHYRVCAKEPVTVCGADRKFTTSGGASQLSITAEPALYPDFDPAVSDWTPSIRARSAYGLFP